MKPVFILILAGLFAISCASTSSNDIASDIAKAPTLLGEQYRCEDMVHVINSLRHLGKKQALLMLRSHLATTDNPMDYQAQKILIICRLLFINPQGWKAPRLGHPSPDVNWELVENLPNFPIILSDGVPFFVIKGYESGGYTSDTAEKCLVQCEDFKIINGDFPVGCYEKAAHRLIESNEFRQLYRDPKSIRQMSEVVLRQAGIDN